MDKLEESIKICFSIHISWKQASILLGQVLKLPVIESYEEENKVEYYDKKADCGEHNKKFTWS